MNTSMNFAVGKIVGRTLDFYWKFVMTCASCWPFSILANSALALVEQTRIQNHGVPCSSGTSCRHWRAFVLARKRRTKSTHRVVFSDQRLRFTNSAFIVLLQLIHKLYVGMEDPARSTPHICVRY